MKCNETSGGLGSSPSADNLGSLAGLDPDCVGACSCTILPLRFDFSGPSDPKTVGSDNLRRACVTPPFGPLQVLGF